jgi:hypothetical protein
MFKKGDRVEILNWGSSYGRSVASNLARINNIDLDKVSNWSDEVRNYGIKLPAKATVIDLDNNNGSIYNIKYLLKLDNCNWHIVMAEASLSKAGVCVKKLERTNQIENIKVIRNEMATIVILPDGSKGISK